MQYRQTPNKSGLVDNFVTADEAPTGPVLLVEPQHEPFYTDHSQSLTVTIRINHVRTLVNRGETAETHFGDNTTVITTTTVNDRRLARLDWETERDLVCRFNPDYHVPCDYPVYKEDDPAERRTHVRKCLKGTIWMATQLHGVKTRVIPLLKGETAGERGLCHRVFAHLGVDYCVFYGTQYFTASIGFYKLLEDLRQAVSEAPRLKIMLIGLQAAHRLEQLPPQVVAAAGQRWIDEVQFRKRSCNEAQQQYTVMDQNITAALGHGQMPIGVWTHEVSA